MALEVEDGTAKSNSESYISVADADTYHSNRGNATWAALSNTVKEQLLRKATQHMVATYRSRWKGYRVSDTQALDWPRHDVPKLDSPLFAYYDYQSVPNEVKNACAELALIINTTALTPVLTRGKKSVTVGPVKVDYDETSSELPRTPLVDRMLSPLCGGARARLVRT